MSERWLPVPGYEGCYEVSDHGRFRSLRYGGGRKWHLRAVPTPVASVAGKTGHHKVRLYKENVGLTINAHRLVLEAFVGPCPLGMECRHLDGNARNNHVSNLAWGTHAENMRDAVRHGTTYRIPKRFGPRAPGFVGQSHVLTADDVRYIREHPPVYGVCAALAKRFGVTAKTISRVRLGQTCARIAA